MGTLEPQTLQPWLLALSGAVVVLLALVSRQAVVLARLRRHYGALATGVAPGNLEALLTAHLARIDAAEAATARLERELRAGDEQRRRCLQRWALVKYDAFDNVGGAVSYVLALLDDHGDGVLLNSLYSREGSSSYAKQVDAGGSQTALTGEEQRALREAGGVDSRRGGG